LLGRLRGEWRGFRRALYRVGIYLLCIRNIGLALLTLGLRLALTMASITYWRLVQVCGLDLVALDQTRHCAMIQLFVDDMRPAGSTSDFFFEANMSSYKHVISPPKVLRLGPRPHMTCLSLPFSTIQARHTRSRSKPVDFSHRCEVIRGSLVHFGCRRRIVLVLEQRMCRREKALRRTGDIHFKAQAHSLRPLFFSVPRPFLFFFLSTNVLKT
jgi:hypothetical protein